MDERYFIVAYSLKIGKEIVVGNAGFETDNEEYINHKEVLSIIRKSYKANPFDYAHITAVMEVKKKDYEKFWEK